MDLTAQIPDVTVGRVAQTLALHCPTPMEYVAVDDKFGESGTPDEMLTNYHLRATDIVEKVHKVLTRKK